jgi:hypothetical protein
LGDGGWCCGMLRGGVDIYACSFLSFRFVHFCLSVCPLRLAVQFVFLSLLCSLVLRVVVYIARCLLAVDDTP